MKKPLILAASGVLVILFAFALTSRQEQTVQLSGLPWQIEVDENGESRVFGLHLGTSTLDDAYAALGSYPEVALFVSPTGERSIEAFFEKINLGGLIANLILELDVPEELRDGMDPEPSRMEPQPTGSIRVPLNRHEVATLKDFPITSIAYSPRLLNLEPEQIKARFGEPDEILPGDTGNQHWLYPRLGLDIVLREKDKEVFQYVRPRDFARLRADLARDAAPVATVN